MPRACAVVLLGPPSLENKASHLPEMKSSIIIGLLPRGRRAGQNSAPSHLSINRAVRASGLPSSDAPDRPTDLPSGAAPDSAGCQSEVTVIDTQQRARREPSLGPRQQADTLLFCHADVFGYSVLIRRDVVKN